MKCNLFPFFFLFVMGGGGDFGSGSGSKFNCAARVGSGRVRRSRVRAGFGLQFWARADLYIQHTPSLNCCGLVEATELWAPERPDTGTVSSLRQSISWTLDIKCKTHNTYTLFIHHTYLFSFQICTFHLYIHNFLYNCVFDISHIAYLYICTLFFIILLLLFLLSVSCPVAVILLHCGASVTITIPRMCKHTWPIKLTHFTHTHVGFYGLRGLSIGVMVFILYKLYVLLPYTYPTPKRLMIYKHFELWGHWKCPHKSPSPCNTHVIPMSLY